MHFAFFPFVVGAALGAVVGWVVRDREVYKSQLEQGADAETAVDAAEKVGD